MTYQAFGLGLAFVIDFLPWIIYAIGVRYSRPRANPFLGPTFFGDLERETRQRRGGL